ncbi:hypothetical protein QBC38DRAFT_520219 [Podospora fimiseda]|uniref:Aminoglycoside phosphotransferase domain-containing protein n=1 Tax=Podospora fimiseda TaxID=252190 RepID=A0AAN6YSK5_9PEZI|nr:hypothetical protein QBC38DRAFT_520219 [Podospora fimiseda]
MSRPSTPIYGHPSQFPGVNFPIGTLWYADQESFDTVSYADDESSDNESIDSDSDYESEQNIDSDSDTESEPADIPDDESDISDNESVTSIDSGFSDAMSSIIDPLSEGWDPSSSSEEESDNESENDPSDSEPSDSDSECDSDNESDTSSCCLGEERFATLAITKIWPGSDPADILVEKQRSYEYMRSTAVTHLPTAEKYVVRAPWWEDDCSDVKSQLERIRFLQESTTLPTVSVIMYDLTPENPLERSYIVTNLGNGKILREVYKDLDHQTRCQITKEVGQMYRQMLQTQFSVPGDIITNDRDELLLAQITSQNIGSDERLLGSLEPSYDANNGIYSQLSKAHEVQKPSVTEVMYTLFDKWRTQVLASHEESDNPRWMLRNAMEQIHQQGYLQDVPFTHCNAGFDWDSILVDPSRFADGRNIITAIRDLDNLEFSPAFSPCLQPHRLWNLELDSEQCGAHWQWTFEQDIEGFGAFKLPDTEEGRELKAIFDEAAGPIYRLFAYDPVYIMAHHLWKFCLQNTLSTCEMRSIRKVVRTWKQMRREELL